jgi:glutathione S-transferase
MTPLRVYGSSISYFTGKLEGYLRYKEIPYQLIPMTPLVRAQVGRRTGTPQMPAVELPDGRWMTDTTPMIGWFESQYPESSVIPRDPLQAFASRLVEDYADEWLWRPALHFRWSYRGDALLLSRRIVDEMMPRVPVPGAWKRFGIRQRQLRRYVRGDGITAATRDGVEAVYLRSLDQLAAIFATRPFLLGAQPTLADFGFFASMFRHFGLDPTPAAIMLRRAPAVYEWVARLWNARASQAAGALEAGVPADWSPILREIGGAYLPYLCANAQAWKAGQKRFDAEILGVPYRSLPTSRYRVWCLEKLRSHCEALRGGDADEARRLLEAHDCWEPLWRIDAPASGYDADGEAPFARGLPVFGG